MHKIHFIDVTNRDTVQAARMNLAKLQKTMVNVYLGKLGIYQSEFGFPCLKSERNYIRANLALKRAGAMNDLILEGWCRAIVADVRKALSSGTRDLKHFIPLAIPHSINRKYLIFFNFAGFYLRKNNV